MLFQMMLVLEGLATLAAFELPVSRGVRQHMTLESVNVHKSFVTDVTYLVAARHMCGHMTLELRFVGEAIVAFWARKIIKCLFMTIFDVLFE